MNEKRFYIYGAGIVASTVYTAIKNIYDQVPNAFYVSDTRWNLPQIDGIPVLGAEQIDSLNRECMYLVATPKVHHDVIADRLLQAGVTKDQLIFVDNQLENKLLDTYFSASQEFVTASEFLNEDKESVDFEGNKALGVHDGDSLNQAIMPTVFQAKCHVDKVLRSAVEMPEYIQPIQVGAALTDMVISSVQDNLGENISAKNRNYCELTATYYAWKNSDAEYKGLCHYRRIFELSAEQVKRLFAECDVDVILPYPSIHYPDISVQHKYCVNDGDWNAMLQALQEVAPDYYNAYEEVFGGQYFYNFNMLIAKREVFDDYCQFMFSVLERAEELTTPKGWERADRFAGYMGENLTTLYFRKNRDKLKIAHAGKLWLV